VVISIGSGERNPSHSAAAGKPHNNQGVTFSGVFVWIAEVLRKELFAERRGLKLYIPRSLLHAVFTDVISVTYVTLYDNDL